MSVMMDANGDFQAELRSSKATDEESKTKRSSKAMRVNGESGMARLHRPRQRIMNVRRGIGEKAAKTNAARSRPGESLVAFWGWDGMDREVDWSPETIKNTSAINSVLSVCFLFFSLFCLWKLSCSDSWRPDRAHPSGPKL